MKIDKFQKLQETVQIHKVLSFIDALLQTVFIVAVQIDSGMQT